MQDKLRVEHIDEEQYKRIFVFGDLHGSLHLFDKMIKKISPNKDDLIVMLGDSCDRGKDSIDLYVRYLRMINEGYHIKHIMGNHEVLFLKGFFEDDFYARRTWIENGGARVLDEIKRKGLNKEYLQPISNYILQMPHIISSKSYLFVHAAYDARRSEEEQDPEYVQWSRDSFWQRNNTEKEIYYGHTINRDNTIQRRKNNCYSMDVGAYYFDNLSIMEIKSKEIFRIKFTPRDRQSLAP